MVASNIYLLWADIVEDLNIYLSWADIVPTLCHVSLPRWAENYTSTSYRAVECASRRNYVIRCHTFICGLHFTNAPYLAILTWGLFMRFLGSYSSRSPPFLGYLYTEDLHLMWGPSNLVCSLLGWLDHFHLIYEFHSILLQTITIHITRFLFTFQFA